MDYESLLREAGRHLERLNEKASDWPAPQVTVLTSAHDRVYVIRNDGYDDVLTEMARNQDTRIQRMLTVWKNGTPDLPYFGLRKALMELDAENANADILFGHGNMKKLAITI